jgi:hypothetical protein
MTNIHAVPADNRMAFIGASTGIPPTVQSRLDAAPSRLANLQQDISADELKLPRFSLLFSSGVFQCMRDVNPGSSKPSDNTSRNLPNRNTPPTSAAPDCHQMGRFFGTLGNLAHQLNTAKLADCQFMIYDKETGDISTVPLPEQAGCIQCHWTQSSGSENRMSSLARPEQADQSNTNTAAPKNAPIEAQRRIDHVHHQIDENKNIHHPDLIVSDNADDVKVALSQGTPAIFVSPEGKGRISSQSGSDSVLTDPLLIALDFDCTLAGAEGDWLFTQLVSHLPPADRLNHYKRFEMVRKNNLLGPGPALTFAQALAGMKKLLALLPVPMDHRLAFAIVTARGHATKDRVHRNLGHYLPDYQRSLGLIDVPPNESSLETAQPKKAGIYFMDGQAKRPRLESLQADLYLDDSVTHSADARGSVPTGEILWGPNYDGQRVFETHPSLTADQERTISALPYVMIPPPPKDTGKQIAQ